MNPATRVPRPRTIRDSKSGFDATPVCAKHEIAEQIRHGWTETLERIIDTGNQLIAGEFRKADYQLFGLPFNYSWGAEASKDRAITEDTEPG